MRSTGVHHVDLVVSSHERSLDFYRGPLGWTRIGLRAGRDQPRAHPRAGKMGRLALSIAAVALMSDVGAAHASQPVLRPGSRGAVVRSWQRAMNTYANESGWRQRLALDGIFGRRTEGLTLRLERANRKVGFRPVGLREWKEWIGSQVTAGGGRNGIKSGDFSGFVGWWQVALNRWLRRHHRSQLIVDCLYGSLTTEATRIFQRAAHLPATGVATRRTWDALERLNLVFLSVGQPTPSGR